MDSPRAVELCDNGPSSCPGCCPGGVGSGLVGGGPGEMLVGSMTTRGLCW